MIVAYISAYRDRFGVEPICRVLSEHGVKIAPSTYYAGIKTPVTAADLTDAYLANEVVTQFRKNRGVYGVRKLWHTMCRAGHDIGRDQVARLMRIAGIEGIRRGAARRTTTTEQREGAPRHPDLIGRAWDTPTRPDQWWVADFSYVWTLSGFCYVALLTDVYSRRILGWRVSTSKATPLVTSVLEQALFTRRRTNVEFTCTGLVHHSDAGSQGGFNWSSHHLEHGGVRWDVARSRCRRRQRVRGGSGRRIGRCGRRCVHRVGLSRLVRCSGTSGGGSRRA